jgi:hypothetical protein
MDQGRDIGGIGIAVADEALTRPRLENCGSEYPSRASGIARFQDGAAVDTSTAASLGKPKQPGMGNIPASVEVFNVSACDKNLMLLNQLPEGNQDWLGQVSVK